MSTTPDNIGQQMQLERLLLDATGMAEGASQRSRERALAVALNARYGDHPITPKGVSKWFARGRIPGPWLMRIASLPEQPLNLADYA